MPIQRGPIALLLAMLCATAQAQPVESTHITVRETLGIRRTEYPVNVRVPFPKGAVTEVTHLRLRGNDANDGDVAAQFTIDGRWDDGSAQWVALDFNATIGAGESRALRLEYGNGVTATATPRGLSLTEDADTIKVGSVTFSKSGWPLLKSVAFRGEIIGPGKNGLTLVDVHDVPHDFGSAASVTAEIVKRGPLSVLIRYAGRIPIDEANAVPVVILCEMPNSKSWVKVSATIEDPAKRVRSIVFDTPFALGAQPWTWDFGSDTGTYGVLRTAGDGAVLTQHVAPGATNWQVETVTPKDRRVYETSVAGRAMTVPGWGHLLDAQNAIAFAIDRFARQTGTYSFSLNGAGQASIALAATPPTASHQLTVYQHYVGTPVAIGAATSPAAMVTPLTASVDRDQYLRSGQRPPPPDKVRAARPAR